jgi:rod shape-determining protein MreC
MSPKRRRRLLPVLVVASLGLCLLPAAVSQKARLTLLGVFSPLRKLGLAVAGLPRLFSPSDSPELRREVDFLKGQVDQARQERDKLRLELAEQASFRRQVNAPSFRSVPADVIVPADGSPWRKSLVVSPGSRQGVQKGMLVLYGNHVVGRILEVGPYASRVQLVTDSGYKCGAVAVPRSYQEGMALEARHMGLYEGTSGEKGVIKWLQGEVPAEEGASILTTEDPFNGVPRGLLLGRVTGLSTGRATGRSARVEPAVNFRGLEQVTILGRVDEP